jgi:hypothetical protein
VLSAFTGAVVTTALTTGALIDGLTGAFTGDDVPVGVSIGTPVSVLDWLVGASLEAALGVLVDLSLTAVLLGLLVGSLYRHLEVHS